MASPQAACHFSSGRGLNRDSKMNSEPAWIFTLFRRCRKADANAIIAKRALIACVAGRARERDGVAHVGEAGDVGQRALEAEPEARMRHRAVAAQVAVPGVVLLVDAALRHARIQHLEPLLA